MRKIILIYTVLVFCSALIALSTNTKLSIPKQPINGFVPDDKTAIKVAEAVWLPIFGDEIYNYKPFRAELIDKNIWKVHGTLHTEKGGTPIAFIQKSDCKIIKIYHEK